MSLPPGVLAQSLVGTFPQFTLCDAGLNAALRSYLNPTTNPDASQFLQWLQNNPDSAAAAGDILNPPAAPQSTAAPLDAALVGALLPLLVSTSSWIIDQAAFEGVAWTVQTGIVPGPEAVQPANGAWRLTTAGSMGGLEFTEIAFSGPVSRTFTLSLINDQPRHLSAYASFSSAGAPVVPANWRSRLPPGVPSAFETDTIKYVGVLVPNTAVAGIAVDGSAQEIAFALPDNADAAHLLFGGLGSAAFSPIPDAAGIILTFVLDVFVPWVVTGSGQGGSDLSTWFDALVSNPEMIADVIASGAFLLQGAGDTEAMFSALSNNLCGVVLGKKLSGLRRSIASQLGSPSGQSYSWVDQFAPAAGWPAQLVQSFLVDGLNPQYWAASVPATIALDLSPSSTVELDLDLVPDPVSGIWPYRARDYQVTISYAEGFSQTVTGPVPPPQSSTVLKVGFGSVRNAGPIHVSLSVRDSAGIVLASATASLAQSGTNSRIVAAQIAVAELPVVVGPASRYKHAARLAFRDGGYVWDTGAAQSTAVGFNRTGAQIPALTSLNKLTLQGAQLCLGYAWGASNQNVPVCGGTAPLQNAYFIQNIGTAMPPAQYESIDCGLVRTPLLAYAAAAPAPAPGLGGYYLDTQGTGAFLRPVVFGTGHFELQAATSVAQFPDQSGLVDLCLHPAGYAAAVSLDRDALQIVALAPAALADADAPMATPHGGSGNRAGLLSAPVAVAVTPGGFFLVLEQGNARVQAFDVGGNPTPLFNGQSAFALQPASQPVYRDLTVSGAGLIYVLGSQNGGARVADFFLDIYGQDGALLSHNAGVNAAKIAVDARQTLYTLDFDTLLGASGRIEPTISAWHVES